MKRVDHLRALALLALALAGCFGTDTGNPPVSATLTARSSDPRIVLSPADGEIVVTEAWVSIPEVRFVLGAACDHASEVVVEDIVGDVLAGVPTLIFEEVACGLHLSPASPTALPSGVPDALRDRTLLVRGLRADGTPFEVSTDGTTAIDVVSATDDVVFARGTDMLVAFDVAAWLRVVELPRIPIDSDGVARLGPSDPGAETVVLDGSIAIYIDADGDGRVGPAEEATGPIAESHGP